MCATHELVIALLRSTKAKIFSSLLLIVNQFYHVHFDSHELVSDEPKMQLIGFLLASVGFRAYTKALIRLECFNRVSLPKN